MANGPFIPPPEEPPHIPVEPLPPSPLPDPGGFQAGTGKGHWGYSGTEGGVGTPTGGGGGAPMFPWGGYAQAYQQGAQGIQQGLDQITGGYGVGSPFYNMLMGGMQNPYGIPPELLAQQRRMLAETAAGSRENALRRSKQMATAKGFGDSLGAIRAQDQIRTESASNLNNAMNQLAIQDALLAQQRQMGFGGLIGGLYGTDAQLRAAYGNIQAGRQYPIFPTGSPYNPYQGGGQWMGGGQQQPGWSQTGQYMPGGVGYDPFYQGGGAGTGQGTGYTPQNPYRFW